MIFIFIVLFSLMRMLSLLMALLLCYFVADAQPRRGAVRKYNRALKSWSQWEKNDAFKKINKAVKKAPADADINSQLGQWYYQQQRYADAARAFRQAYDKCKNGRKLFALPLARSLLYSYLPDSALAIAANYIPTPHDSAAWAALKQNAWLMKTSMRTAYNKWPSSLGPRVNTKYPESFPSISPDGFTLYFNRKVNNVDEDFYLAHFDSCGELLRADNMGSPPNTHDHECAQYISADGHYLFFTRSDNRSSNGWAEGGYDLFTAYRISPDSEWTIPQPFGGTINTPAYEGQPGLSPDNRRLYFVSDRPGGYGGKDIWISYYENAMWQTPVNAGPAINSKGDETAPFISLDNKTLFFTSDGRTGMGGKDIYVATRINDSNWKNTQNLGYPINTVYNDEGTFISPQGTRMFFSSDRQGPAGNFDLYEAEVPAAIQPSPVSYLSGYVYDSITRSRLNFASMYLINARNGDTIYHFYSNRGDGSFLVPLSTRLPYALHTLRIGYTELLDTFSFTDNKAAMLTHNVCLLPSDYVAPIYDSLIATIHFDINKVELSESDRATLQQAIDPFLLDKGLMLHVNGYTDNTGTPMLNEELSTKRANLVASWLVGLGIDELNIVAKGWGEAKMVAPNDTEENQKKNRRVEILLTR